MFICGALVSMLAFHVKGLRSSPFPQHAMSGSRFSCFCSLGFRKSTMADKSEDAPAKAVKPSKKVHNAQDKVINVSAPPSSSFADTEKFVEEILEKTSALLIKEITKDTVTRHGEQLGSVAGNFIRKHLNADLKILAMTLKNTAYAEGFQAGTQHQPKRTFT